MAKNKLGQQTIKLDHPPVILGYASVVGPKEGQGPLGEYFTKVLEDEYSGEDTWEKAEMAILIQTMEAAIKDANLQKSDIDYMFAGDLLNQLISTNFAARTMSIPFVGLYGACSTMAESLALGAIFVDGGYADRVMCSASSHFCSAERQYRMPLEQGGQRPMYAQWTVTGSGTTILSSQEKAKAIKQKGPYITHVTIGKVQDYGVTDESNMGAAMAPAAVDTILRHLKDTGRDNRYYDLIVTGDLGIYGVDIAKELCKQNHCEIENFTDCGAIIYDREKQDTHGGGSGCGCSGSVLNGYLLDNMHNGKINKILFIATGALLSPTSTLQGESIPCVAHAIAIENTPEKTEVAK